MRFPKDAITAAAFSFELARGVPHGPYEVSEIQTHGLDGIDPELLARELRYLIIAEHKSDSGDRQQAYWALGKKRDSILIPFFRDQLRLELTRDMIAVYQIMIALQDMDEPTFGSDRSGYSIDDYELNRRDAESYLEGVSPSPNDANLTFIEGRTKHWRQPPGPPSPPCFPQPKPAITSPRSPPPRKLAQIRR